jgi:serine/threonine-protein kinase
MIGKTIGKYRFVERLGRGGSGAVYKAVDETLNREVAIRVLEGGAGDKDLLKRFQAEAATLARLRHPDIVGIHEFHPAESELFLVMELVRGETLDELAVRCGPLPPERAAYLVGQVLGALDHAHNAGVVHRDLKPSSVIVTDQGGVKVMDFGLTRMAGADQMTADGFTLTTPAYMAPERLLGREIDGRADIYSAGVLFYRLLTGHVPYEAPSPLEMVQKQLAEAPTPVRRHRQDLPGWCQAILDRALARAPADRFPTADAFRAALQAAISETAEDTGVYPVAAASDGAPAGAVAIDANAETVLMSAPVPEPLTVATLAPSRKTETRAVPSSESAPSTSTPLPSGPNTPRARTALGGTTLILKKNQFTTVGAILGALVLAVVVLVIVALRQPTPATGAQTGVGSTEPPAMPQAAPGPEAVAPAPPPVPSVAAQPPAEIVAPELVLPPSGAITIRASGSPPPAAAPKPTKVVRPPFQFEAKAVVADGEKRRERDAVVLLADGAVTVKEKDRGDKAIYVVPLDAVVGLTFSSSKQPLWSSPDGPAEAMRVEGGAFGFLKGGVRNWFGLRTRDSLLVVRVEDSAVAPVTAGLQEHTGLTVERLAEPKD